MIRTSASRLKAKMGRFMREVRAGKEVIITDRDRPVAKLVPIEPPATPRSLVVSQPRDPTAPPLGKVAVRPTRVRGVDSLTLLREDRDRR